MNRLARIVVIAVLAVGLWANVAFAQGTPDLEITKTADRKTVKIGETITYTITLTNLGPDAATDIVFGDPIADQLNLVSSTCGNVSAFCTVAVSKAGPASLSLWSRRRFRTWPKASGALRAFIAESSSTDANAANDIASATVRFVGPLHH